MARTRRRRKKRAYRNEDYWGKPVPGFGDPSARIVFLGLAPAAHGQTAPAACLPVTAVAIGCFGRCIGQGWPTSRNHCRLTTGLNSAARGYLRRCAVPLLQINRQPKNEIPVSRFRSRVCVADKLCRCRMSWGLRLPGGVPTFQHHATTSVWSRCCGSSVRHAPCARVFVPRANKTHLQEG